MLVRKKKMKTMHPNVHSSIIHSGQDTKTTEWPSIDNWIKMWYMDYYSAIRKDEILPFIIT